ncbi:MAG: bifunctional phosphopantothenoylcysteine decarboxylase/phosphopantothenate--cysteine ligase CoaBC [Flavobacteriales bacterium]|jgi:phosphopantothenoylcysteine decarboxylase/phosphopantothenate--cysteine ligase
MLEGKKILVGISGSIAAYKSAWLIRLLIQAGAEVKVVLTKSALDFVTPLTLSTLSKNPVYSDFTENKDTGEWTNHVGLALWADMMIIAPASANTLAKMTQGQSDNFLITTYMSARCPILVAPAMDHDMYQHAGTQENLKKLEGMGHQVLQPRNGELASGLIGNGRMAEPEEILDAVLKYFRPDLPFKNKTVLVTAGPTYEAIDPVRFIGNRSSGKMGFEIAKVLAEQGAQVILVSGPTHLTLQHPAVKLIRVESAEEMYEVSSEHFESCQAAILSAAVADYRPMTIATEKIKKSEHSLNIRLEPTPDIAKSLGAIKKEGQILVGFALETENEEANAQSKMKRKNFDMIVLNSLKNEGAGFGGDTNKISLFWPDNKQKEFGLKRKSEVARDIVAELLELLNS